MHLILDIPLFYLKTIQLFFLETLLSFISLMMPPRARAPVKKDTYSAPSTNVNKPSLRKRHSWPPLHKRPHASNFQESVDENPFSYFISDPFENGDAWLTGITAGIDNAPRSRSYSPRHRTTLMSTVVPSSPTKKLKKWIEKMELRCFHRSPRRSPPIMQRPLPSPELFTPSKTPLTISPPVRGRRNFRVGSTHRITPNGRSKPRRTRAWKAPSAEIWPVAEETEGESVGLGIVVP